MPLSPTYRGSTGHAGLGPEFYDEVEAARFPQHILRHRNQRWAERVGLGTLTDDEWIDHFGRFEPLPDSFVKPLALRYHGHQFQVYNPELGDGRGFLFAQLHDDRDRLLDLGTKGSGRTPWSRTADGRLTLKGGVREVLATEMLEALGVNTSKIFSLIETGESLHRGDEPSPTRSSVLVRLSHGHVRIGTFQRLLYLDRTDEIARLVEYCVRVYMPEAARPDMAAQAAAFLQETCSRVAAMGAAWMLAGFVHGVLNTDNININGESFDYGPWRFLPTFQPRFTAAYFDQSGLYAYAAQPDTLLWNLTRLAECLLPLGDKSELEGVLTGFAAAFRRHFAERLLARLALKSAGTDADNELVRAVWTFMNARQPAFERFFFDWHGGTAAMKRAAESPSADLYADDAFEPVVRAMADHEPSDAYRPDDPYFQRETPCTMLIDEVEALWKPIAEEDDWSLFERKLAEIGDLRRAYEEGARA